MMPMVKGLLTITTNKASPDINAGL